MRGYCWFFLATALLLSACAPSLSPLYRDYEILPEESAGPSDDDVYARILRAFEEAGWTPTEAVTENVIATEVRTLRQWGIYKTVAYLEAAPVSGKYVRLFIHPYRRFITGGRSKIPYLSRSLRGQILPDINEAFEKQGLKPVGRPYDLR
jgi:hypothetical protein